MLSEKGNTKKGEEKSFNHVSAENITSPILLDPLLLIAPSNNSVSSEAALLSFSKVTAGGTEIPKCCRTSLFTSHLSAKACLAPDEHPE